MRIKVILLYVVFFLANGCYNPEEDLTTLSTFEFSLLEPKDNISADGFSSYNFVIKLPGVKYGSSKEVTVKSSWGTWLNGSNSTTFPVGYNEIADIYSDTIRLKAGRTPGPFRIEIKEDSTHLKTVNFIAVPQFPSFVQIVSDSINLKLAPGNSTKLQALFFNERGLPSYNTKFRFVSESQVNIYPNEVILDTSKTEATLQVSTETKLDTVEIYGIFPDLEMSQHITDTLKIVITN